MPHTTSQCHFHGCQRDSLEITEIGVRPCTERDADHLDRASSAASLASTNLFMMLPYSLVFG